MPRLSSAFRDGPRALLRSTPRKAPAGAVIAVTAAVIAVAPPRVAAAVAFTVIASGIAGVGALVAATRRAAVGRNAAPTGRGAREAGSGTPTSVAWLEDRLWGGFSGTALARLEELGGDVSTTPPTRSRAHAAIARWHTAAGTGTEARDHALLADLAAPRHARKDTGLPHRATMRPAPARASRHFDTVLVSNFSLPGGTTGSNVQEITAQRRAGLRTGLVHHPVFDWDVSRPVNPKILALVDNDRVRFIGPDERVTCDLLVVRVPKIGERLLEDMPDIRAATKIVIINQTPMRDYGPEGATHPVWDIGVCLENFTSWLGEHRWYPIGPSVRDALTRHHAAEMAEVPLADDDWLNIIDLPAWQRAHRRARDGRVRVGRHSRDNAGKWPETPETLRAAYPGDPRYEIHVLGGASTPERTLGRIPDNWVLHGFDTLPVRGFLHGLDCYVYFTKSDYLEAFGRAPLEAIASGLPTILPARFKELFGDAAIYSDAFRVRDEIELLLDDEERYAGQVERGFEVVRRRFDYGAHLRRIAALGVGG